jgi:DNA-binding response OmpR family regulator
MDVPILIVDDDADYRASVVAVLCREGYNVRAASNVKKAWKEIRAHRPEIILVDWNMPGADGIRMLKELRANNEFADMYAIMVTARSEPSDVAEGMGAGADDYLRKPYANEELLARVRVGVRTRKLQKDLAEHVRRSTVLEMAGSVAHEIGNPLTAAKLLYQRLAQNPAVTGQPEIKKDLDDLGSELARIEELVRKAQSVTTVVTVPYAGEMHIIDIDRSGEAEERP